MKSKLLRKLRRQFADTHKVERERSLLFGDYQFILRTYKVYCMFGEIRKDWACDGVFSTEEGVRKKLRELYEAFIEEYLRKYRKKRIRKDLTYWW
jgi:hypothetical protein